MKKSNQQILDRTPNFYPTEYRGLSVKANEWVYGNLVIEDDQTFHLISGKDPGYSWNEVHQETVGALVGIIGNRKLYDGDVYTLPKKKTERFIVSYDHSKKRFGLTVCCLIGEEWKVLRGTFPHLPSIEFRSMSFIGNKFDIDWTKY